MAMRVMKQKGRKRKEVPIGTVGTIGALIDSTFTEYTNTHNIIIDLTVKS